MVRRSDGERARDPTIGFYPLAVRLPDRATFAFGLYSHGWDVPGGWYGPGVHVHANAWGFLWPRGDRHAVRSLSAVRGRKLVQRAPETLLTSALRTRYRPARRRTGARHGEDGDRDRTGAVRRRLRPLYLYAARTYRAGTPSGTALSVLVAQLWILGPPASRRSSCSACHSASPTRGSRPGRDCTSSSSAGATDRARGLAARRPLSRAVPWNRTRRRWRRPYRRTRPREASPVGRRTEVRPRLEPRGPRRRDRLLLSGPVVVGATARPGFTVLPALWGYHLLQIVEQWWSARTQTSSTRV